MIWTGNSRTPPQSAILLGSPAGRRSSSVQDFRFFDVRISAFADPESAVAEVQAEALIKQTGRRYRQQYGVFLWASGGEIAALREYFNPIRAAKAMNATIVDLDS